MGYWRERRATNARHRSELGVLTAHEPRGTDGGGARLTPGAARCVGVLTARRPCWPSPGYRGTDGSPHHPVRRPGHVSCWPVQTPVGRPLHMPREGTRLASAVAHEWLSLLTVVGPGRSSPYRFQPQFPSVG